MARHKATPWLSCTHERLYTFACDCGDVEEYLGPAAIRDKQREALWRAFRKAHLGCGKDTE